MSLSESDADVIRAASRALLTHKPANRTNRRGRKSPNWPYASEAMGVHPDQIPEAREHYRKHGLAVDFTKDGAAIMSGPGMYRAMAKADGIWNGRDGFSVPGGTGREPHRNMVRQIMESAGE